MPWKYSDQQYTDYTRSTWNETAGAYRAWASILSPYRQDVVRALAPKRGEALLDLATGPGEPALTLAERVGPSGSVVGIDLSREMIAIARRESRARKLPQARFRTMDGTKLAFPDDEFDGVTSSFGFQIFTNPERVAQESYRVVRRGGRIAASIWGPGERTPLLHAIMAPMLKHAEPDESGYLPSPYEMREPGQLASFLRSAGFKRSTERRVSYVARFRDADDYLSSIQRSTPIGHSLSEEPAKVRAQVERETRANLRPWSTAAGIRLPGEAVIVTARK